MRALTRAALAAAALLGAAALPAEAAGVDRGGAGLRFGQDGSLTVRVARTDGRRWRARRSYRRSHDRWEAWGRWERPRRRSRRRAYDRWDSWDRWERPRRVRSARVRSARRARQVRRHARRNTRYVRRNARYARPYELRRRRIVRRRQRVVRRPTRLTVRERPLLTVPAGLDLVGVASYYGGNFHGRLTASGVLFDMNAMTAAHRTLPFGTRVRITHLGNGRTVDVRITDRGPFIAGRIIDLSRGAAGVIGMHQQGVARVKVTVLGR
jgi:hypothetical protein